MTPLDPEWEALVRAVRCRAKLVGELQRLPASPATLDRLLQEQAEGERLAGC